MTWFFLSLLTAISVALRDVSVKAFTRMGLLEVAVLELFWSLPFLVLGLLLIPVPELDAVFWWTFIISLPLNIIPYFLYLYAIKLSPLTLTVPFLAFTPAFMILTGLLILGEAINLWGGVGIILIVSGSYVLNINTANQGLLGPFTSLFREKGPRLMLLVAFLYSFAAVVGKKAILHSSPLFFTFFFFLVFNSIILVGLFLFNKESRRYLLPNVKKGVWLGGLMAVHVGTHGLAIAIATAVYMVAVKRSSILFTVLLSRIFLKEEQFMARGLGAMLMFSGVLFITLLG